MTEALRWQKSTFSGGGEGDTCIELAAALTTLHLRESDNPPVHLTTTPAPLAHLLKGIRSGALTPPAPPA